MQVGSQQLIIKAMGYDKWKLATPDKSNDFEVCTICLTDISPYNTNTVRDGRKTIIVCNKCNNTHFKK